MRPLVFLLHWYLLKYVVNESKCLFEGCLGVAWVLIVHSSIWWWSCIESCGFCDGQGINWLISGILCKDGYGRLFFQWEDTTVCWYRGGEWCLIGCQIFTCNMLNKMLLISVFPRLCYLYLLIGYYLYPLY